MELVVSNLLSGERRAHPLADDELWIGREPGEGAGGLRLASPLVSRRHLRLFQRTGHFYVEHHGLHPSQVEGQPLLPGVPRRMEVGDAIRLLDYSLVLRDDDPRAANTERAVGAADLHRLEGRIHERLLEQMDLRRGTAPQDLNAPEARERIEACLRELVAEALAEVSEDLLDFGLETWVKRRLNWRITAAGGERAEREYGGDASSVAFEEQLERNLLRIAKDIGIGFDPRNMEEESRLLERRFDEVYRDHRLEFSDGLREHVMASSTRRQILDVVFGLGPLQDLVEMESISEIMVVSRDQIFVEKFGVIEDTRRAFYSDELVMGVIERIVAPLGRRIDRSSPLVDAHLPDGSRVNAVIPPLATRGPCITIRKFASVPLEMDDLIRFSAVSRPIVDFLRACVEAGLNIIVSGGTGSGKTTFLNCLSSFVPKKERIVTIEDTVELQLKQSHVVTLQARPANAEGTGEVTIRDLVRNALRMRPDRIIVGECRGAETLDMLQAMNTGHDGSMATAHANSPDDLMLRLETMVLTGADMPIAAIRSQIASALDLVVQLQRSADGRRRVTFVSEVMGTDRERGTLVTEDVFRYLPDAPEPGKTGRGRGGRFVHTGYVPTSILAVIERGHVELESCFARAVR